MTMLLRNNGPPRMQGQSLKFSIKSSVWSLILVRNSPFKNFTSKVATITDLLFEWGWSFWNLSCDRPFTEQRQRAHQNLNISVNPSEFAKWCMISCTVFFIIGLSFSGVHINISLVPHVGQGFSCCLKNDNWD